MNKNSILIAGMILGLVLVLAFSSGEADDAATDSAIAGAAASGSAAASESSAATETQAAPQTGGPSAADSTPKDTGPVRLPPGIVWETNNEDPPLGSDKAIRGGTLRWPIDAYPLTFRLVGPNSNDAFATWNRLFTMDFALVGLGGSHAGLHPMTARYYPVMATHWSIQEDQKTLFFKLDPDARWSDGEPITADDYVFTLEMMRSPHIVDPFYNEYAETYYESIDKIDDYTIRIVGKQPSWRPLTDFAQIWPTPKHKMVLDSTWVDRANNEFQVTVGPYAISEVSRGESVTFTRQKNWWGDKKRYFRGMYNFDQIVLKVIPQERNLDYLRQGELDLIQENTARSWNEQYTFPDVRNNYIRRSRVFVDWPSGIYGLHMNLEAPIFQNKDFRKAMQYLFNFDRMNRNLMFSEYFRQKSFFEGTEYADVSLEPYKFDPVKAREHLNRAGYHRPDEIRAKTLFGRIRNFFRGLLFTRTDTDDILVNDKGEKASFTLIYGSRGLERHLTVAQQEYRRAGVDMKLRLLEPGTAFERGLERKYEMIMTNRTAGFYPDPRQYLHSNFTKATNNNDIWGFGMPEVDSLIEIYDKDLDHQRRLDAVHRIDQIVHDEAFYIPFWAAPYIRLAYWDYVQFPEFYLPRQTEQITDFMVYWIDPARKDAMEKARAANQPLPPDPQMDKDFYNVRARFGQSSTGTGGESADTTWSHPPIAGPDTTPAPSAPRP
jgi:microcin C transport system substrate-binding protein